MNENEIAFASIEEIARLYRSRKLSPVETARAMLARIEQLGGKLNAFITVTPDLALQQAKKAEAELFGGGGRKTRYDRGLLHGIPISLKDNIYTKNVRTTAGSAILKDFAPLHDAKVVRQLKDAGAVFLGKTNMHEFAYGVTTENPHFGPARNPWDRERTPGGSSGGSAAAVAAGLCFGSIGTDTGGSIRIPAALCGVVGLKPGLGRVSVEDVIPLSPTLDFVGPIARTAADTAHLLDPIFLRGKGERIHAPAKTRGFRVGIPREFFNDVHSPQTEPVYREALRTLRKRCATFSDVSVPLLHETEDAGNQIAWAEATHYHQQAAWFPILAEKYGEDARTRLEAGTRVLATAYLRALEVRNEFIQAVHIALDEAKVDALAVPTTPIAAPRIGEESILISGRPHSTRGLLLRNNRPANLAGIPAISIPCGLTDEGLPVGLQLIGAVTDEPLLLQMAQCFEKELALKLKPPGF